MAKHHSHLHHTGHGGHGKAHHRGHHVHPNEHVDHVNLDHDGAHDHVHPSRHQHHGTVHPHNAMGGVHMEGAGGGKGHRVGGPHDIRYGKDHPENFIEGALTGIHGPSEGIHEYDIGHGQKIMTPIAMDNVVLAADIETSILDDNWHGDPEYLGHSLKGVSAVNEDVGAAGPVHHDYIENH